MDSLQNKAPKDTTMQSTPPATLPGGVHPSAQPIIDPLPPTLQSREVILVIARLFVEGYTIRKVAEKLKAENIEATEDQLLQLYARYADDIVAVRDAYERRALEIGLARKATRITKLSSLAEKWEDKAQSDEKSAGIFIKLLEQLRKETEAVQGLVPVAPNDPWHILIVQLSNQPSLQNRPKVERELIEGQFTTSQDPTTDKSRSPSKASS